MALSDFTGKAVFSTFVVVLWLKYQLIACKTANPPKCIPHQNLHHLYCGCTYVLYYIRIIHTCTYIHVTVGISVCSACSTYKLESPS